jgi:tetratricopeptide (TPR) repeat protein
LRAEALFQQQLLEEALPLYEKLYDKPTEQQNLAPLQVTESHIKKRLVQVNMLLASNAFQRNDFEKARNRINRANVLAPENPEVQKNVVFLHLQEQEWKQALEAANKALESSPEDRDLLRMKASALYNLKDYEGLRKEYKTLYQQDPDNVETALTYAQILVGIQKSSEAEKIYKQLLELYPKDRRIYQALIDVNERRLNLPGKREVLRRMEKQFPDDQSISNEIAATFEQEEKWGEARAIYDSLLTHDGNTISLQKKIAQTYVEQDSLQKAKNLYQSLYQDNKTDKSLVLSFGEVLERSENWNEAHSLYQEFLLEKIDKEVLHRVGIVLIELDHKKEAIHSFRKAIKNGSENPEVYLRLSQLLADEGSSQLEAAKERSVRALTLSLEALKKSQQQIEQQLSKNSLGSQIQNVRQFEELSRLDALAEESFKHFTKINSADTIRQMFQKLESDYPGSGRLLYLIGSYYERERQSVKAKRYYQQAVRYSPKLREAHLSVAKLFEQDGEFKTAITSYERALALDPQKPEAYDALIRLNRKQGKLNTLCDRWMARYRADTDNAVLKNFLIEALHKAGRYDEAKKLINSD